MALSLPFNVPFIRFAQEVHWNPGHQSPPRRLYDHELFYVVSGQIRIELEDRTLIAPADHLLLIPPRARQRFLAGPEPTQIHLGIHFDWLAQHDTTNFTIFRAAEEPVEEDLFREVRAIPGWDSEETPVLNLRSRPRVRQVLYEVIAAHAAGTETLRWQAGALLALAISQISHEAGLLRDLAQNPRIGADAVRRVHRARELLEEPCRPPLSVSQAAAQVGWSPDHMCRMFRSVLGVAPHRIQLEARLRRAKQMLLYRNICLSEIAYACGFYDASHFTTAFKKEIGLTPQQFVEAESTVFMPRIGGDRKREAIMEKPMSPVAKKRKGYLRSNNPLNSSTDNRQNR